MLAAARRRLTFANVVSMIALFAALGGTAVALSANSVGTRQLKRNAVTGPKVRNHSLTGRDIRTGTLKGVRAGNVTALSLAGDGHCTPRRRLPAGVRVRHDAGAGICDIRFRRNISRCAISATAGVDTSGVSLLAQRVAAVDRDPTHPKRIFVEQWFWDGLGANPASLQDSATDVIVVC
jgi:hypothetical protein